MLEKIWWALSNRVVAVKVSGVELARQNHFIDRDWIRVNGELRRVKGFCRDEDAVWIY